MTPEELLMKTVLEAWGRADLGPAREALDENVIWKSASTSEGGVFRFGGVCKGRVETIALLSQISVNYFFRGYIEKEIISKGEIVWGLFDSFGSYVPSGGRNRISITLETAFRWRIRDGKIVEAQSFFDTAALLAQQGQLSPDLRVA